MVVGESDPKLPHGFLVRLRDTLDRALPPGFAARADLEGHRARMIVASGVVAPVTAAASTLLLGVASPGEERALAVAVLCMAAGVPLLWWRRSTRLASHSTTAGLFAYCALSLWASGGALPYPTLMIPIAALNAALLCSRRAALGWVGLQLVALPAAAWLSPAAGHADAQDWEMLWASLLFSLPVLLAVRLYRDLFERVLAERTAMAQEARSAAARQVQLAAHLRSSELQNGLGRMAGGVAHEFNNILAAIGGTAELISLSGATAARERALARRIGEAVDRASTLVRQLLDFTGRGRRRLELQALGAHVERAERLLRATLSKKTTLAVRVLADAWVLADPTQLEQLIVHLVQNAERSYGGKPGEVWVEADALAFGSPPTTMPPEPLAPGSYAVLRVIDRGRGIDPEHTGRIFEPFYSAFEGGRGLGLSAALGIVRSHGGGIAVDSTLGAGTTVTAYLPRREPAGETARALEWQPMDGEFSLAGRTVLVVDDEAAIRAVLTDFLRAQGAAVLEADDGEAALALISRGARLDAAFVDVSMPRLDGLGLVEALRAAGRNFPVVLMTGHGGVDVSRFEASARVALVRKPFALSAVRSALARAAHGPPLSASDAL